MFRLGQTGARNTARIVAGIATVFRVDITVTRKSVFVTETERTPREETASALNSFGALIGVQRPSLHEIILMGFSLMVILCIVRLQTDIFRLFSISNLSIWFAFSFFTASLIYFTERLVTT